MAGRKGGANMRRLGICCFHHRGGGGIFQFRVIDGIGATHRRLQPVVGGGIEDLERVSSHGRIRMITQAHIVAGGIGQEIGIQSLGIQKNQWTKAVESL